MTAGKPRKGGEEFGATLKRLREVRGVSQSKLAERASFDHSYVSRLESAARTPTRDAVDRLAEALHLTEPERDLLLRDAGFRAGNDLSVLTPEEVLAVEFLRSDVVADRLKEDVLDLMRGLVEIGGRVARAEARVLQEEDRLRRRYVPVCPEPGCGAQLSRQSKHATGFDYRCPRCNSAYMTSGVAWREAPESFPLRVSRGV